VIVNHELAIKRKLCTIRSFYDYLFKNQRVSSNVTELVPLPKVHEKPIIRLSKEEMVRMLEQAQNGDQLTGRQQKFQKITAKRDYAILSLFLGTGIRVSECIGMNIGDVDLENNAFIVTRKGGNQVVLYFPPEVAEALADYIEERERIETVPGHEDALFLSLQRRRITQRAVQNLVKKYAAVAAPLKTRISPHKLRSTYATNLYNETGDIYLVADVLGHTSVDTTRKHYADMTDARRRMAAEHVHLPGDPDFSPDR
jgi:site-specific recombinase XerD